MGTPVFRFRVENDIGLRSQDWRVWATGAEVYVAARATSHDYKASFHSSGQCQIGISAQLRRSVIEDLGWEGKSRLFSTWIAPPPSARQPIVPLLELMFPDSHLDQVALKTGPPVDVLRSEPGMLTSVGIFKTMSSVDLTLSPSPSEKNLRELCRVPTADGHDILLLTRLLPESDEYNAYVRRRFWSNYLAQGTTRGRTYGSKLFDSSSPNIRALVWEGHTERKFWHELSVRRLWSDGPSENTPYEP